MESTETPPVRRSKIKVFIFCLVKIIGIVLVVTELSLFILYIHLNFVRRDCFLADWICDVSDAVNASHCFHIVAVADRFSMTDWWGITKPRSERTAAEQNCIEQQNHLHSRCYLPHFINKQSEKYQAKQRGEEFYGDAEDCRDIEIKDDGEKQ